MSHGIFPVSTIRFWVAIGFVVGTGLVLVCTPVGEQVWDMVRHPSARRLERILPDTGIWLAAAVIGLMILHTLVPLPAELLALAAGMTLGPFWGSLTTWIGAMLGAFAGFFLARTFGRPFLNAVLQAKRTKHVERWLERLHQADVPLLLAVRLLPVISFNLINYTLGLTRISWWRFTWTTGVGIVPVTVFMVIFGAPLHRWWVLALMIGAAVLVAGGGYWLMRGRFPILTR
jgi:uncharacterized membrane protein YdjX (TVP38/TMEM64 family)